MIADPSQTLTAKSKQQYQKLGSLTSFSLESYEDSTDSHTFMTMNYRVEKSGESLSKNFQKSFHGLTRLRNQQQQNITEQSE